MTNYAQFRGSSALLFTPFGEQMASRHFSVEELERVPRYVRGKHVGAMKGRIVWSKVVRGGWVRGARATASGDASGRVENRVGKIIDVRIEPDSYGNGVHLEPRARQDLEDAIPQEQQA